MSEANSPMQHRRESEAASDSSAAATSAMATPDAVREKAATTGAELARRIFSFPAMLATLLVGAVFYVGRNFVVDPDLWWHLRVGQDILSSYRWPTTDPYSFTVAGQS